MFSWLNDMMYDLWLIKRRFLCFLECHEFDEVREIQKSPNQLTLDVQFLRCRHCPALRFDDEFDAEDYYKMHASDWHLIEQVACKHRDRCREDDNCG